MINIFKALKRKILSWWWKQKNEDCTIIWWDEKVECEIHEDGHTWYHIPGHVAEWVYEDSEFRDAAEKKIVTRRKAEEELGAIPCGQLKGNIKPEPTTWDRIVYGQKSKSH